MSIKEGFNSSWPLFVLFFAACYILTRRGTRIRLPYPPGPKGWPIIGNIFDAPDKFQWLTFTEWAKKYGNIVYLNLLGQHMIVINSRDVAEEWFGRRANVYSDRPVLTVMTMNGWDVNMGLKQYGDDWRRDRRSLNQHLRHAAAVKVHPIEESKATALLHGLLKDPENLEHHFSFYPAAVMMHCAYGHHAKENDSFINLTFSIIGLFSGAVFPGSNLLNLFPPLKHLPSWYPIPMLQELHKRCANCREFLTRAQDAPFQALKDHIADGTAVDSWVANQLETNTIDGRRFVSEDRLKTIGITAFPAAIETMVSALSSFVLAMVMHPVVQARAHAEIDEVIGDKRLPTFKDRPNLPYIEAVMQEVLRWHPPPPMGIPHATSSDDVYEGHLIPKGAVVIYNLWAMCHDERAYADPFRFNPERFLSRDGVSAEPYPPVYGFGRRICAGHHAADDLTWIAVASMISVFRFDKAKDKFGRVIEVKEEFTDSIVSSPAPFDCSIQPRSEVHRQLILANPPAEIPSNPIEFEFDKSKYA